MCAREHNNATGILSTSVCSPKSLSQTTAFTIYICKKHARIDKLFSTYRAKAKPATAKRGAIMGATRPRASLEVGTVVVELLAEEVLLAAADEDLEAAELLLPDSVAVDETVLVARVEVTLATVVVVDESVVEEAWVEAAVELTAALVAEAVAAAPAKVNWGL